MSAHGGQDWFGFAVVVAAVTAAVLLDYAWTRVELWLDTRATYSILRRVRAAYDAEAHVDLIEVDHTTCANPDCGQPICCCRRPVECTGHTTLGCDHLNQFGGLLCWDCRVSCRKCAGELRAEQALAWAAGR